MSATEYGDLADRLRLVRQTASPAAVALGLVVMAGGLLIRRSGTARPGPGPVIAMPDRLAAGPDVVR